MTNEKIQKVMFEMLDLIDRADAKEVAQQIALLTIATMLSEIAMRLPEPRL